MVQINSSGLVLLLARLLLAGVFILAGLPKIQDPVAFAASVDAYRTISGSLVMWVAVLLPWLELVVGLGLLTPWLRRASASVMIGLLGLFMALHASAWARGLDIECGCFGENGGSPDYHWLILRNLALLLITVFIILSSARNKVRSFGTT